MHKRICIKKINIKFKKRGKIMQKKLYRSLNDRKLAGVCGGLGEYFGIDSTLIRLIWAVLGMTGAGLIAYIIAAVIVPEDSMIE